MNTFPLFTQIKAYRFWLVTIKVKFIKGKLPFVRITALLLSVPQKLRKQVLKANISSVPGKRKTWGLLTYKTHNLGTSITLPSLCQSQRVSLQQTTSQPGWTARFSPLGVDKTGLKSSLEKKSLYFSLHYKLLEKTDGGDDRESNYFFWASFLSGF